MAAIADYLNSKHSNNNNSVTTSIVEQQHAARVQVYPMRYYPVVIDYVLIDFFKYYGSNRLVKYQRCDHL